jgi:Kef-type K+ transport system membrane component KefB
MMTPMELAGSDPIASLALGLAIILAVAKIAGHFALRLGAPAVLGELLAGILLGNLPVPFLHDLAGSAGVDMLARFGAMILVFEVGLQLTIREVFEVGVPSILVAVIGTVVTFVFGFGASAALLGVRPATVPIFLGAALTATSIGITARVLKDLGHTRTREARIVLGAAVLDDVIGLVVLTVVSGFVLGGGAAGHEQPAIGLVVGKSVAFLAVALFLGARLSPRMFELAARLKSDGALMAVGLSFCFFLAWAASMVGLAAIIGAFTAGLIIEESHSKSFVARGERSLAELVEPLSSFLVPIFFVIMGMRTHLGVFRDPSAVVFALVLTGAAIVGKLACAAGAGRANRLAVAVGMMPRGEVCLVYASLGFLDAKAYSSLVMVVVVTTLLTPAALKWSFRRGELARATARANAT